MANAAPPTPRLSTPRALARIGKASTSDSSSDLPSVIVSMCMTRRREHQELLKKFPRFAPLLKILAEYLPMMCLASFSEIRVTSPVNELVDSKGRRYIFSNGYAVFDENNQIVADRGTRRKRLMATTIDSKDRLLVHQWVLGSIGNNRIRRVDPKRKSNRIVCDRVDTYFDIFAGFNDELIALTETELLVSKFYPAQGGHANPSDDAYGPFQVAYRSDCAILQACYHPYLNRYYVVEAGNLLVEIPRGHTGFEKPVRLLKFSEELNGIVADPREPRLFATDEGSGIVEIRLEVGNQQRLCERNNTHQTQTTVHTLIEILKAAEDSGFPCKLRTWHISDFDSHRDELVMLAMGFDSGQQRHFALRFQI